MRFSRFTSALVALLVAALLVPSGWMAAAEEGEGDEDGKDGDGGHDPPSRQTAGRVLVPTLISVRPFTPASLDGITHYHLETVRGGAPFELVADSSPWVPVPCLAACTPDFDIIFYGEASEDGFEHVAGRFNGAGNEKGRVPLTAEFAFVFLRGSNLPPDLNGSPFTYSER